MLADHPTVPGPRPIVVLDPHKHFLKDVGEEMRQRHKPEDYSQCGDGEGYTGGGNCTMSTGIPTITTTRAPRTAGFWMCERFEAGFLATKIQLRCRMVRDGGRVLRSGARCPSRNERSEERRVGKECRDQW